MDTCTAVAEAFIVCALWATWGMLQGTGEYVTNLSLIYKLLSDAHTHTTTTTTTSASGREKNKTVVSNSKAIS